MRLWSIREEVLHVAHEGHFGGRISTYWYLHCNLDYNLDFHLNELDCLGQSVAFLVYVFSFLLHQALRKV